jgi:threonine 3-dehydrogenase
MRILLSHLVVVALDANVIQQVYATWLGKLSGPRKSRSSAQKVQPGVRPNARKGQRAACTLSGLDRQLMESRKGLTIKPGNAHGDYSRTGNSGGLKMKALVKSKAEPGLWLEEIAEPKIGINDVLIRVRYTGICGTDVHICQWDDWAQKTISVPIAIGHEFVGQIVEVGSNVSDFYPGDIVSGEGHVVCGRCRNCLAGRRHLCAHTKGVGVNRPGAFAEFIALPMTNIWRHDPKINQEVAAIFDPFGNAVHTALSFPVLGEDVLITGAGPIGIMAIPVLRHAGARHIVITDMNPFRLELARKMGATLAVNPTEISIPAVQKQLGMLEGFDVGLEMSGNGQALQDMIANMSHGGKVAILGIPSKEMTFDWRQVIFNMLTIKGIYGREMYETWYKMSVLLESGVDISPVITHRFAYSDFQQGFDAMISGKTGKVVLDWTSLV